MATKLYKMTLRRTYARIIIKGETGNEVIYEFTNGNPINSTPARCLVRGEYEQNLMEKSQYFKNGIIKLERVTNTEEDEDDDDTSGEAEETVANSELGTGAGSGLEEVSDVKTVTEAIAYVADHFEEKATTAKQAKDIAEKFGVSFPNLKVGKK